jgi:SAM-dependent methyltransferase
MPSDFYDKVAKKFGAYTTGAKYVKEFVGEDPEKVFREKLLKHGGSTKVALDVGCADGRYSLTMSPNFEKVIAIDLSRGMLEAARKFQRDSGITNVSFLEEDSHHTSFPDSSFDLVYSRRGPSDLMESYRLLRKGGYFIEITIGEKDCQEIKEVFGRGQDFGKWDTLRLDRETKGLNEAGFNITFGQNFFYNEYYQSYQDLEIFLQGVPIFEDFDPVKDKVNLEEYTKTSVSEKGIKLPRHRIVIVALKH